MGTGKVSTKETPNATILFIWNSQLGKGAHLTEFMLV